MSAKNNWLIPDGFEELLPPHARYLEQCRAQALNTLTHHCYELVSPPQIEFLDVLLSGAGKNLDLHTFKLTDQMSGKMMGLRADITPQMARIKAHYFANQSISRLAYSGPVFLTGRNTPYQNREQLQIGAELFGYADIEADFEIISLALTMLTDLGISDFKVELGDLGIINELLKRCEFNPAQQSEIYDIFSRRSLPDLNAFFEPIDKTYQALFIDLLQGQTLNSALLKKTGLDKKIDQLNHLSQKLNDCHGDVMPQAGFAIDLAEVQGYRYHTGVVFNIFHEKATTPIVKGGRYQIETNQLPATGFSADLRLLSGIANLGVADQKTVLIQASMDNYPSVQIKELQNKSYRTIMALPNEDINGLRYDAVLVYLDGQWQLKDSI